MAIRQVESDLEFKDQRTYVNSTTLSETVWRLVCEWTGREAWREAFIDATFSRMTGHNGVFWLAEDQAELAPKEKPNALIRVYNAERSIWIAFVPDASRPVERRSPTERCVKGIRVAGRFSGECAIETSAHTSFLENVVEGNKQIHLASLSASPSPRVIHMYTRRFPIALAIPESGMTSLRVENVGVREQPGTIVTLNRLTLPQLEPASFEFSYLLQF